MKLFQRVPLSVCLGLAIAIVLDTGVQIFWKLAVSLAEKRVDMLPHPMALDTIRFMVQEPLSWLVALLFTLQLVNWLKVLEDADLSYSQPITSLSYISVVVLSAMFLKEHVTVLQIVGIGFILTGVWFISRTEHNTVVAGGKL